MNIRGMRSLVGIQIRRKTARPMCMIPAIPTRNGEYQLVIVLMRAKFTQGV
jgi:hypothetical protein